MHEAVYACLPSPDLVNFYERFATGQASSLRGGKSVTCVWCRAETNSGGVAKGRKSQAAGTQSIEGYLNLASVAGLSPVRDTSTCASKLTELGGYHSSYLCRLPRTEGGLLWPALL